MKVGGTPGTRRIIAGASGGLAAAAIAAAVGAPWFVTALLGWNVAAIVFLTRVWWLVRSAGPDRTAELARAEDSRPASEAVLIAAGTASLLVIVVTLARASHYNGTERGALTIFAIVSVALAWLAVHVVYLLRYAREYFSAPVGGIDFEGGPPDYQDFAYLALTIGMTFQVSDTNLTATSMRHLALRHGLLSYLFGTVVVAITINAVAGLIGR